MRLLTWTSQHEISLTEDLVANIPPYAILSHTWGADSDEVSFADIQNGCGQNKVGYDKIRFCGAQARKDGIEHFWVDTCCINKDNLSELSEAITSMYRWYHDAVKCYAYLADVSSRKRDCNGNTLHTWESSFRSSRWFTRGWTLQELLAPRIVEFFSQEKDLLGDKTTLLVHIRDITGIPEPALKGVPPSHFSISERMEWALDRQTKKKEDKAYCLLGIFNVYIPLIYGEQDHAFVRLQEEIDKRFGVTDKSIHVHWLVPRSGNPLFTGREDLLRDLDRVVRDALNNPWAGTQCRIVLSGIGGQGKSETCLQLARRLRHLFWAVLWIDISTTEMAERSFIDIARKLSITAQSWEDARLGVANLKHPWLLILDNADAPDTDYQDYFPDSAMGVVILTSRNDECQQYATTQSIRLEGLRDEDARGLLLKSTRISPNSYDVHMRDATVVAHLLQSHALALIQAGAYISRGYCTLADYPEIYKQQRRQLLAFRPTQARSRYGDVYATFEVSMTMLKATHTEAAQDALQLLPLLAMCGPSRFPSVVFQAAWAGVKRAPRNINDDAEDNNVSLLTPWHIRHIPPFLNTQSGTWDLCRLMNAVSSLKAFALVSTDSYNNFVYISMHALVHAWARDRQNDAERCQNWLQIGCVVAFARKQKVLSNEHRRGLQPHIEALTEWDCTRIFATQPLMLTARILVHCGWYLHERRADAKLYVLTRSILQRIGLDYLRVDQRHVGLYDLTARNLRNCGRVKEAASLLEQIVKIDEQTLAENHPDRLARQHSLASVYVDEGQVREAIIILEKVVKTQERTLAEEHPDRLTSKQELASAYHDNGQTREAIKILEQVVRIVERVLAEEDPDRLHSQHELASAYHTNGQVREAITILEQVVRIRRRTLAEEHPERLSSEHELGNAYSTNGQFQQGVTLLEQVVRIKEQTQAEDRPSRLRSEQSLAAALWDLKEYNRAYQMMRHVAERRRRAFDEGHPGRRNVEEWLRFMEDELGYGTSTPT